MVWGPVAVCLDHRRNAPCPWYLARVVVVSTVVAAGEMDEIKKQPAGREENKALCNSPKRTIIPQKAAAGHDGQPRYAQ